MPSVKQAQAQAVRDMTNKLKLERIFSREIKSLFRRMRDDFVVSVSAGAPVQASKYTPEWVALLEKHYKRVQGRFSGTVSSFNEEKRFSFKQEEDEIVDPSLMAIALLAYRDQRSNEQADFISETNQNNFSDSIREAQIEVAQQELPSDNRTLAAIVGALLARKFVGRVNGISILETQASAEATKLIEAQLLSGRTPFGVSREPTLQPLPTSEATKQWWTVGDDRVRLTHEAVNRTTVDIDDNFIVGGFPMRHPGDSSLGAPIKEIARCRCSVVYTVG